jgi:hypothetical protein
MPTYAGNLSPSAVTYAQELRVAFQLSSSLNQISDAIGQDAVYRMSDGTRRDPTYTVKEKGKIRKFWQSPKDQARIRQYLRFDKMLEDGSDFLKAEWYRGREWADYEHQAKHQAFNLCPLISAALTDLTVGGGCTITTGIPEIDTLLNEDLEISAAIYQWLFEASVYGFVGVQVVVNEENHELEINRILPHSLYVQKSTNRDKEPVCISKKLWMPLDEIPDWENISANDMLWGEGITGNNADGFVFEERHYRGLVEHYLWVVKRDEITGRLPLKYYIPELPDAQLTGLQDFAITIIPNETRLGGFHSDWADTAEINRNFNDRASRINELLNKYEAPNLMVSENQATLDPVTGKVYYRTPRQGVILVRPQDNFTPAYLQPQVQTQGSENNLAFQLKMLSMHSQVSPALLDPGELGEVQSGVAYKLRLTPTLAKVNRRRVAQKDAVKRLVFNFMSVINFHHRKSLVQEYLDTTSQELDEHGQPTPRSKKAAAAGYRLQEATNRLGESGHRVSLSAFQSVFDSIELLHSQPHGVFLKDPRYAQGPEDLQYLANQDLLDYISQKEEEMYTVRLMKEIRVEFVPALPQDEAQALQRLGQKASMSLRRYLTDFDDLSEEQVEEEIQAIQAEEAATFTGFGGLGVGLGEDPGQIPDALNTQSTAFHAGATEAVVNTDERPLTR